MTTATAPSRDTTQKRAALSRELSEFLIELSIGVHRYSMYPENHPSLRPAVENLVLRMSRLFEGRRTIDIGVAQKQLVIEGVATDPKHPVLADLARRLHDHQLGAISLESGVGASELQELLALLARDADHDGEPVGTLSEAQLPRWSHVTLHPLGYDRLQLKGAADDSDPSQDRATQLWLGLAQAALKDREVDPERAADATEIARGIAEHQREEAYDQVIVGYMLQLAEELKTSTGAEAVRVRAQVTTLIREMDGATLDRLVQMGGDVSARQQFILDANESLAVDAVVKVLQSAASASEQTVSNSMTRLLTKLSRHSEQGSGAVRARAGSALRENVEELISEWELTDPNPDQYTRVLDAMAHASPVFDASLEAEIANGEPRGKEIPGPLRIMQMALEVDAFGPTVEAAVLDMIDQGLGGDLFRMIDLAPEKELSARVRDYLTNPDRVRDILSRDGLDDQGLDELILQMGDEVVGPLFDVLLSSDSRSVRRRIFDRLVALGEVAAGPARQRLEREDRWFVIRNLISLLAQIPDGARGLDIKRYLEHEDARVRREALPLALKSPDRAIRERTMASALADPDDRIVRTVLVGMRDQVPDAVVPSLVNRVVNAERDEELRVLGIRVLKSTRSALAREALIDLCVEGTSLFGKVRIADSSPVLVAAVGTLASTWPEHKDVKPILSQALKSKDPILRRAAEGS